MGGLGVAYFGIFFLLLPLTVFCLVYLSLPRKVKSAIKIYVNNIE